MGRTQRSGRCSGLHLVCFLLQLLLQLLHRTCRVLIGNGKQLMDGIHRWPCYVALGFVFSQGVDFEPLVFHDLSTSKTETKARSCLHLVCIYVSLCVTHLRCFLSLRMLLLTSICKGLFIFLLSLKEAPVKIGHETNKPECFSGHMIWDDIPYIQTFV